MTIFCSQCGVENYEDAVVCSRCQAPIARPVYADDSPHEARAASPLGNILLGLICLVYLINPTAGFLEFLPDNLPIFGNLDEAAAVTGLLMALSNLKIIPWRRV